MTTDRGRFSRIERPARSDVRYPPIADIRRLAHYCATMKSALLIVGILAVLMGLLWVGQGMGIIDWPASSFMIDQRPWVTRGALLALVGLILIAASSRFQRA